VDSDLFLAIMVAPDNDISNRLISISNSSSNHSMPRSFLPLLLVSISTIAIASVSYYYLHNGFILNRTNEPEKSEAKKNDSTTDASSSETCDGEVCVFNLDSASTEEAAVSSANEESNVRDVSVAQSSEHVQEILPTEEPVIAPEKSSFETAVVDSSSSLVDDLLERQAEEYQEMEKQVEQLVETVVSSIVDESIEEPSSSMNQSLNNILNESSTASPMTTAPSESLAGSAVTTPIFDHPIEVEASPMLPISETTPAKVMDEIVAEEMQASPYKTTTEDVLAAVPDFQNLDSNINTEVAVENKGEQKPSNSKKSKNKGGNKGSADNESSTTLLKETITTSSPATGTGGKNKHGKGKR
jgi:hypothetical protein